MESVGRAVDDVLPEDWKWAPIQTTGPGAMLPSEDATYRRYGFRTKREILEAMTSPKEGFFCPHCEGPIRGRGYPIISEYKDFGGVYLVTGVCDKPSCVLGFLRDMHYSYRAQWYTRQFMIEYLGVKLCDLKPAMPRLANKRYYGGFVDLAASDLPSECVGEQATVVSSLVAPQSWIMEAKKRDRREQRASLGVSGPEGESRPSFFEELNGLTTGLRRPTARTDERATAMPSGKSPLILNEFARRMDEMMQSGKTRAQLLEESRVDSGAGQSGEPKRSRGPRARSATQVVRRMAQMSSRGRSVGRPSASRRPAGGGESEQKDQVPSNLESAASSTITTRTVVRRPAIRRKRGASVGTEEPPPTNSTEEDAKPRASNSLADYLM